jgi:hypothetical protein
MKFRSATLFVCVFVVTLALFAPIVFAPKASDPAWTFMVYLDCDNNLDTFGQINLQQLSDGLAPSASVNVVVLMDRLNLPAYTYEVTHEEIKTVQSLGEVDMGSQETLASFITYALNTHPTTYYFLDVWDHGGGYVGTCWDESSGNHLSPHDVETAVAEAEVNTGNRVQVIGFDACLMGMVEVCYELKDVTDIVVGSEMLIPGYGWPYASLMSYISSSPTVDPYSLSATLVNEYVAYYPKVAVQLSAINEALFMDFTKSLDNLVDILTKDVLLYKDAIAGARSSAQQKLILGTEGAYFYVDLYKFTCLLSERTHDSEIGVLCAELRGELNAVVFSEAHNQRQGNLNAKQFGLTIYFPPNVKAYNQMYETYVPCFAQETAWLSFLASYYCVK